MSPDDRAVIVVLSRQMWLARALALIACTLAMGNFSARAEEAKELSTALEHDTFDRINQYRVQQGFPKVIWDSSIAEIARQHSRNMATGRVDFGHGGFPDRMHTLRGMFAGMRGGGENVFYTDARPGVAEAAVQAWLHSPPHLHNIRGDYTLSGLGLWKRADGAYFFTQIFVKVEPLPHDIP